MVAAVAGPWSAAVTRGAVKAFPRSGVDSGEDDSWAEANSSRRSLGGKSTLLLSHSVTGGSCCCWVPGGENASPTTGSGVGGLDPERLCSTVSTVGRDKRLLGVARRGV